MNPELAMYASELEKTLQHIVDLISGLDADDLNWRPDVAETNSLYVSATHTIGNLRAWVLGIACQKPIKRDRSAEFAAQGANTAHLMDRAKALTADFESALRELPSAALDEVRTPQQQHWGLGPPRPLSVREALIETIRHAWEHIGEMQLVRQLRHATAGSTSKA
jgi:hypothetical protein